MANDEYMNEAPDGQMSIKAPEPLATRDLGDGDPEKKIETGKVPKPAPKGMGDSATESEDEPLSSETISLKRKEIIRKEAVKIGKRPLKISCYHCAQKLDLTDLEPFAKIHCPSCSTDIIVPKWFDNYLLEEPGGKGGMATVYRALDLTLDREVAIKVLAPEVAQAERAHLFLHEARTAATLNHYAVLPIYTCGEFEKQPYIVMQYMEGGSLDKKLDEAKENLPVSDVVKWIRDVAEGLDNARRHGIIHHDIKPANLMMDKDGNIKIGDFGIAQALRDSRSQAITKITGSWASPHFVSPEKAMTGKEDYTGDIYSLGASFYQLITKRTPFEDDADLNRLVRIRTEQDPPPPKKNRADIPPQINDIIMKMMARKPEDRPSYRDLINSLNTFLKEHDKRKDLKEKPHRKGASSLKDGIKVPKRTPLVSPAYVQKKNPIISIVLHLIVSVVLLGTAFFLYKSGVLDKLLGKAPEMPSDLIQEATAKFRAGECREAGEIAEQILTDPDAKIQARKQAALQVSISKYLSNEKDARELCAGIASQLGEFNVKSDDPCIIIINFLASEKPSAKTLRDSIYEEKSIHYSTIASLVIHIRNMYDKTSTMEMMNSSNSYIVNSGNILDNLFWGNAWRDRMNLWKEWVEFGRGDETSLEPVVAANKFEIKIDKVVTQPKETPSQEEKTEAKTETTVKTGSNTKGKSTLEEIPVSAESGLAKLNINELTADWLKEHRAFAGARPRPEDYSFSQAGIDNYLRGLPEDKRAAEDRRIRQVSGVKQYICNLMMKMPYDKPVKFKSGKITTGSIMVNPNYISVKGSSGKFERMKWDTLPVRQIGDMLDHYATIRSKVFGGVTVSKSQQNLETAEDYLRIAMLFDWYGDYETAVRYVKKAIAFEPKAENNAKKYFMQ